MKSIQKCVVGTLTGVMLLGLTGCAGMFERDRNTAIGAGIGAVGGAALTGGDPLATVGGAAVGGVIGHEVGGHHR